jgi:Protein of unknown function (DUF3592)
MGAAIFLLVLSCGAIAAGRGYVRTARRMRAYATTTGTVVARGLRTVGTDNREGRWGEGGGYAPQVTYTYTVDGASYESDRVSYARRGLKRSLAEQRLAEIPDAVEVHYDPAAPADACLETHEPKLGFVLLGGGGAGALLALALLLAAL